MLKTTTLHHLEIDKDVEQLIKRCKQHGWYCRKFRAQATMAYPTATEVPNAATLAKLSPVSLSRSEQWFRKVPQQGEHEEMRRSACTL
jgi:hypothetical protein